MHSLPEAMFECAMVNTYFPTIVTPEKDRYQFINDCDIEVAIEWLDAVIAKDPSNYKALLYALINKIMQVGDDTAPPILGQYYAKYNLIVKYQNEVDDRYAEVMKMIENQLIGWNIIK